MSQRVFKTVLSGLMLTAFITGCEKTNMRDLHDYVEEVKQREPERIEPLPEIKPVETFVYLAQGRRDPFTPSEQSTTEALPVVTNGVSPDSTRRKEELEGFPLDSIRMVGTLDKSNVSWGLVTTQDGTIYRVRQGNYMGQNHGQITRISEDRIELTEIVSDGGGAYMERQASVALSEESSGE